MIVATSEKLEDLAIVDLCDSLDIACFQGKLDDVLDRFYFALEHEQADHVVRLTGDCPLTDPAIIDAVIQLHVEGDYDYTSNIRPPTFANGLDVEVIRYDCLVQAWSEATLPSHREHPPQFLYTKPERFQCVNLCSQFDFSDQRWTVDEADDLEFVSNVYEALYAKNPGFNTEDILGFLEQHPELKRLN